jgi:hypothetical protein
MLHVFVSVHVCQYLCSVGCVCFPFAAVCMFVCVCVCVCVCSYVCGGVCLFVVVVVAVVGALEIVGFVVGVVFVVVVVAIVVRVSGVWGGLGVALALGGVGFGGCQVGVADGVSCVEDGRGFGLGRPWPCEQLISAEVLKSFTTYKQHPGIQHENVLVGLAVGTPQHRCW